jgi:hypothetical protein
VLSHSRDILVLLCNTALGTLSIMTTRRTRKGTITQDEQPDWEPLRGIAGDELLAYFMWMYQVTFRDGTALHVYKHIHTRRYLHLTRDGRAFVYVGDERYRPADPAHLFMAIYSDLSQFEPGHELHSQAIWAAVEHCDRREAMRAA